MQEMPEQELPRERLAKHGERALSTSELLSITLKQVTKMRAPFNWRSE